MWLVPVNEAERPLNGCNRTEPGNRLASARDDDEIATLDTIEQARQVRLGRVNVHSLSHALSDLVYQT